jgi:hypothetical protein
VLESNERAIGSARFDRTQERKHMALFTNIKRLTEAEAVQAEQSEPAKQEVGHSTSAEHLRCVRDPTAATRQAGTL